MNGVTLITINKDLEDIMLQEYPGKLFYDTDSRKKFEDLTIYTFENLDKDILLKFLDENEEIKKYNVGDEEYEIFEPRTFSYTNVIYKNIQKDSKNDYFRINKFLL